MKRLLALLMLSFLVVGCGSNSGNGTPPPKGPVAPQPGGGAYGKWDANTVQAFDQYCAAAGDQGFSYQQWYQYCDCIAQFAGTNWSFDDFAYNVEYYYYNVIVQPQNGGQSPDQVCLGRASMLNGRTQTVRELEAAQIM